MIKSILLSTLILVIFSCSSPAKNKETNMKSKSAAEQKDYSLDLERYRSFVTGLNDQKVESSSLAVETYSLMFKGADPQVCDQAFAIFHEFYERLEDNLADQVANDTMIQNLPCPGSVLNGEEIPMRNIQAKLERKWKKNGFRWECEEGMPGIGTDRNFIAKNFYRSVSPAMRKFLKALQENDDKVLQVDAGIVLTEKEFVDRTVWWETFVAENPDFAMIDRAIALKKEYFTFLIYGMNNTSAISYTSGADEEEIASDLSEYFAAAYDYLNKKYPTSETNKLVKPYFKAASARDFNKVEKIKNDYTKHGLMIDFSKNYESYI